jgi:hypothetical protein
MKRIWLIGFAGCMLAVWGQAPPSVSAPASAAPPDSPAQQSLPSSEPRSGRTSYQVVREIDDRPTHKRWLLERDRNRPAGPGRMVLLGLAAATGEEQEQILGSQPVSAIATPPVPVIRAGDRLVIEEDTPVVEARLAAIALGPAAAGSVLNVRLEIGGKVVRALAVGPGQAVFADQIGGQP